MAALLDMNKSSKFVYPKETNGLINEDNMLTVLTYIFKQLEADTSFPKPAALILEPPLVEEESKKNREKMADLLFSRFASFVHIASSAVMLIYRATSLIIDSGNKATWSISVNKGVPVKKAVQRLEFRGRCWTCDCWSK